MRCASGMGWAHPEQLPSQGYYSNTTEGLRELDPKAHVDVVELYAGSPLAAPSDHPSEGSSVNPLD